MVKPFKLFLLLFIVMVLLAIPSFFVPKSGFVLSGYTLKYPTILNLFDFEPITLSSNFSLQPELARLDFLMDSISLDFEVDTVPSPLDTTITENEIVDTLKVEVKEPEIGKSLTAEVLRSRLVRIEFPDSTFTALESFFKTLAQDQPSKRLIRVMHYGDSQIEGDRVSSFLRSRLQKRFGGRGVGLLHAVPHSYQPGSILQSSSSNWQKFLLADIGKGEVGNKFGVLAGYSTISDKKIFAKGGFNEAWIKFRRIGSQNSLGRNFSKCRIFYGFNAEPFLVSLSREGQNIDAEMVEPSSGVNQIVWDVPAAYSTFQIDFKGDESPMVYGVSLESKTGIMVDNIPIRGSSGTDFTRSDDATLKQFMDFLNVRLIILQFGVNIVPHIVDSYKFYENQLYKQIITLKRINPKASVILIGVSDMSRKEGGQFVSFPNISRIRDAQRNAAFRAGAAFWDCFEAMGGENSMPAWVFAKPSLASKDFVHFSLRGSNLIAEMFYSSLMADYESYIAQKAGMNDKSVVSKSIEPQVNK